MKLFIYQGLEITEAELAGAIEIVDVNKVFDVKW